MSESNPGARPSVTTLILVPSIITLAVTILRLVGELQHWSPLLFSAEGGGRGALVGISWLPILFGPYFALKLAGAGSGAASNGKSIGLAVASLVAFILGAVVIGLGFKSGSGALAILGFLIIFGGGFVARAGWPALGTTLFAYGFVARIPVLIVMFIAMQAGWQTHYSAIPPGPFEHAPFWKQFVDLAFFPQMFLWTGYTVVVGSIFGTIVAAIARRGKAPVQATA